MAATDTRQLQLQISASAELMIRNLRRADAGLADFQRDVERRADAIDGRMGGMGERLKGSLAGFASGAGLAALATGFLAAADQAKQLRAQLTLATQEFGSFGQAQADVERIAATTRVGLEAATKLYGNFVRAAQPLGRTQADAATATENFAKALKIGGADANTAAQATLQFSQALGSGVLRGDEFKSINEASTRVIKALADSLGVPVGQMRKLAEEGKLTSDKLYEAFTNRRIADGLSAEFAQLPVTMGEAMQLVRDNAVKLAGAFDEGSGLSDAIAGLVTRGGDGASDLSDSWFEAGALLRGQWVGLAGAFSDAMTDMEEAAGAGTGGIVDQFIQMRNDVLAEIFQARDAADALLRTIDFIRNMPLRAGNLVSDVGTRLGSFFTDTPYYGATPRFQLFDSAGRYRQRRDGVVNEREQARWRRNLSGLGRMMNPTAPARRTPPRTPAKPGKGGGRTARGAAAPAFALSPTMERQEPVSFALDDLFDAPDFAAGIASVGSPGTELEFAL